MTPKHAQTIINLAKERAYITGDTPDSEAVNLMTRDEYEEAMKFYDTGHTDPIIHALKVIAQSPIQ